MFKSYTTSLHNYQWIRKAATDIFFLNVHHINNAKYRHYFWTPSLDSSGVTFVYMCNSILADIAVITESLSAMNFTFQQKAVWNVVKTKKYNFLVNNCDSDFKCFSNLALCSTFSITKHLCLFLMSSFMSVPPKITPKGTCTSIVKVRHTI